MNLADLTVTNMFASSPFEADKAVWRARLDALDRDTIADTLTHVGAVLDLTEVVAGLLGVAGREADFAEPELVLSDRQRLALAAGLQSAATLLNGRLATVLHTEQT